MQGDGSNFIVMNTYYNIKTTLKTFRWHLRRVAVGLSPVVDGLSAAPILFGNAIPKSGSHLIIQVLQGFAKIGPFVKTGFPPVNRGEDNAKLPESIVHRNILRMRSGDIGYGYLHYKEPFISTLTDNSWATIFVYRDPRDVIVSSVKYATHMNLQHGLHAYYTQHLTTDEERIKAAIDGIQVPDFEYPNILDRYNYYIGWLQQPGILSLRFEDLILNREKTFARLFEYVVERGFQPKISRERALEVLMQSVHPEKSGTFRKGKPGGWKENFSEANKDIFKKVSGDLLIRLGYEQDQDW